MPKTPRRGSTGLANPGRFSMQTNTPKSNNSKEIVFAQSLHIIFAT
jgi:hypothetical protein